MRRIAVALILTLVAGAWSAAPGLAQAVQTASTASSVTADSVRADFDNDGFADLAVGVSSEDVGAIGDAGPEAGRRHRLPVGRLRRQLPHGAWGSRSQL